MSEQLNAGGKDFQVTKKYAYYVFALLFLLYVFNYVDRMLIASLFPFLKADWGLTESCRVPSEPALIDLAFGSPAERQARVLRIVDGLNCIIGKDRGRLLIDQIVTTLDGI